MIYLDEVCQAFVQANARRLFHVHLFDKKTYYDMIVCSEMLVLIILIMTF